jgi:hypothetical protein
LKVRDWAVALEENGNITWRLIGPGAGKVTGSLDVGTVLSAQLRGIRQASSPVALVQVSAASVGEEDAIATQAATTSARMARRQTCRIDEAGRDMILSFVNRPVWERRKG